MVWTPEEVGVFLRSVTDDRLAAMWRTAAMTGMRRSEICGLYWADLDLEQGALSVRRAVVVIDGHPHVKAPKTAKSRRAVELDMGTVVALKEWRRCQLEERLRAGEAWDVGEWVFTDQPVNPEGVGKKFRRLVATTTLPSITMRQVRHSRATALLRAGVHPKVVQERLGHSSIGVTLDIYSSVLPTMQREAVECLVGLIDALLLDLPGALKKVDPHHAQVFRFKSSSLLHAILGTSSVDRRAPGQRDGPAQRRGQSLG